ncbi:histidine triad (HIT) protein [Nanobdella aerobiophila]|uniref:Histidine triad (HIT) protein n=1 Tax=Nanobdella aerobiophila TaxID=2586965 RepID=A0A915SA66_9ARCH|nr:HIT family protein [Nanobdella aerobiophila]BBL45547.1 histidine triad (HIT) protein [Nanobdella aerobiophila]
MEACIFCKISRKEIESAIIWENDRWILILDKFPIIKGQSLLIPKEHVLTGIEDLSENYLSELPFIIKESIKILKKGLNVKKVAVVVEGTGVFHFHVKLYPLIGWNGEKLLIDNPKIWFDKYEGYLTTRVGFEKSIEELRKIAEEIKNNNKDIS